MTTFAIQANHISKSFRIGTPATNASYRTLRESLSRAFFAPFQSKSSKIAEEFWALTDVHFKIEPGEVVGIIGHNGAGKSTLLKIFSGVTPPTAGRVELRGRTGSLLEVGTGFHPELTGRENIYLNGSILGMSRREIQSRFDAIVDFSEVEQFLDTPVKRYSSGMRVRLAFSVAAFLEPEILIIDEVLAVGDAAFQQKCLGMMGEVALSGRTVLFVSHNLATVKALCHRGILLEKGQVQFDGDVSDTIVQYRKSINECAVPACVFPTETEHCSVRQFTISTQAEPQTRHVEFRSPFQLHITVDLKQESRNLHLLLILWRSSDRLRVASLTTREMPHGPFGKGNHQLEIDVHANSLIPDEYYWSLSIVGHNGIVTQVENIHSMEVTASIIPGATHPFTKAHGVCHLEASINSLSLSEKPLHQELDYGAINR